MRGSQLPTSEDVESDEPVADTVLDALEFDLTVNDEGELCSIHTS